MKNEQNEWKTQNFNREMKFKEQLKIVSSKYNKYWVEKYNQKLSNSQIGLRQTGQSKDLSVEIIQTEAHKNIKKGKTEQSFKDI